MLPEEITLRDWFAGQALSGLCSNLENWPSQHAGYGTESYKLADAMMEARNNER